jgi:tetratricopeptide (TPR) repeat protein
MARRAAILDPRSIGTAKVLGSALYVGGRWEESRRAFETALALSPEDLEITRLAMGSHLSEGDLAGARRRLNAARPSEGREALLALVAVYGDFYWVLEPAQQDTVMTLGAEHFVDDPASRAFVFAQILRSRGDSAGSQRWAREAAAKFEEHAAQSEDPQMPALAGAAHAFAGRHDEARRWLERAGRDAATKDRGSRQYVHELTARTRLLVGDEAGAITSLEKLAELGGRPVGGILSLHPEFARLRGNPRFDRIAKPYKAPG